MKKENTNFGIGTIENPEAYSSAKDVCLCDNTYDVRHLFEYQSGRKGDVVLCKMCTNLLNLPMLLVWVFIDIEKEEMVDFIPVFDYPKKLKKQLLESSITKMELVESEVFIFWKDSIYTTLGTSTNEIVIKKVQTILYARHMINVLSLYGGPEPDEIYPVELYSHTHKKFIGVCWAVVYEDESNVHWYPVHEQDKEIMEQYENDRLEGFPITPSETAVIGGHTYVLRYNDLVGTHFVKTFACIQNSNNVPKKIKFEIKINK